MSKNAVPWKPEMKDKGVVQFLVHAIFVVSGTDKDDNTTYRFYMMAKQRRDVDPFSPTAGDFVTNIEQSYKDSDGQKAMLNVHSIPIGRKLLNTLIQFNDYNEIQDKYIQLAATQNRPLVDSPDGVCFQAEITDDAKNTGYKGLPTYKIKKNTIEKSDFDFDWERYEKIWEKRAENSVNQLNKVLELKPEKYFALRARKDFAKGQYDEVPKNPIKTPDAE